MCAWPAYEVRSLPFSSWLYRIARNHLIDWRRRAPKVEPVSIDLRFDVASDDSGHGTDAVDRRSELTQALFQLTEEQRSVVVLRIIQGASIEETAQALHRSLDSVKQLQRRALHRLQRVLSSWRSEPMIGNVAAELVPA